MARNEGCPSDGTTRATQPDLVSISFHCGHCGCERPTGRPWYVCARCRVAGYCSRAHQRAALANHRVDCRIVVDESCCKTRSASPDSSTTASSTPYPVAADAGAVGLAEEAEHRACGWLARAAQDVQLRIIAAFASTAHDLRHYRGAAHALSASVVVFARERLRSPWWLLDASEKLVLAAALSFCVTSDLLRAACACGAWHRAS
eukprot:CAMPEP_0170315500 /NCGR_PEP_ID=MMETSP0116_2-20130129/58351_1 /TAXON_ID=400756 /ORGANISM="Durinskia baltica, Strain CSIRO CS-38" /LENGTH=203 /DNA_ID=CAMNT_0010568005 /DNA_START=15 /DNA_END=623 /DNA_ORIENTATION=-